MKLIEGLNQVSGDWAEFMLRSTIGAGLALCALRVWQVSAELTCLAGSPETLGAWSADYLARLAHREAQSRAISASTLRLAVGRRITAVRHLASSLATLGLIGTVVGFIIALPGVDPAAAGLAVQDHRFTVGWIIFNYAISKLPI